MSVSAVHATRHVSLDEPATKSQGVPPLVAPVARLLLAAIFLTTPLVHFSQGAIAYASAAGVPLAKLLVPASGVLAFAGGLSLLLGFRTRIGAALLVAFLVPVTLSMHAFWTVRDPQMAQIQYVMFMKNLGLLGGTLLVAYFGAGPYSLDAWRAFSKRR